jgi:hypothetical protein
MCIMWSKYLMLHVYDMMSELILTIFKIATDFVNSFYPSCGKNMPDLGQSDWKLAVIYFRDGFVLANYTSLVLRKLGLTYSDPDI